MSRAVFTTSTVADVQTLCAKSAVDITAIEVLPSGGTRVVFKNGDAADKMRKAFARTLISSDVERFPQGARARLSAVR